VRAALRRRRARSRNSTGRPAVHPAATSLCAVAKKNALKTALNASTPVTDRSAAASPAIPTKPSRAHRLGPPKSLLQRAGIAAQTLLESMVAKVSRLPDVPVYELADFPWVAPLQAQWRSIRAELDAVMLHRDRIPSFHEILKEAGTITRDESWKTYFLINAGQVCGGNAERCPQTMRLLQGIPGACTAFFSILAPGKHIPAHRGAYNGVLRLHLGLIVPEPREHCRIRIGDQFRYWREGEALIFDDSFDHEVWNQTEGYRVVLFVDFPRPLYQPWHWLNRQLIAQAPRIPLFQEAIRKQREYEKRF
jgi:aspartyl/asparaginyl beta-hydroxylase (cupin superfamily)